MASIFWCKYLCIVLLALCTRCTSAVLQMCTDASINTTIANSTSIPSTNATHAASELHLQNSFSITAGVDVAKACMQQMEDKSNQGSHFAVVGVNDSFIIESEVCTSSVEKMEAEIRNILWRVALRSRNKHLPLFAYPGRSGYRGKELNERPELHRSLDWAAVHDLPFVNDYCLIKSGQLQVLRFRPEMAGTYQAIYTGTVKDELRWMDVYLNSTLHHLDYVYDSDQTFDGTPVQQASVLAPKVTIARMFGAEKNLRYKYRASQDILRGRAMSPAGGPGGQDRYPKLLFKNFSIGMTWTPPPELHQFSDWKPSCGTIITRERYMRCTAEVDADELERNIISILDQGGASVNDYDRQAIGTMYNSAHGLAMLYHLHVLAKSLKIQVVNEARLEPNRRLLYSAGMRWSETAPRKISVPCHYTFLHHLPRATLMHERRARIYIPEIQNVGEREQAVRLCGLADPLELLRMLGQVLVKHLKRLVSMTRQRPVVPRRSVEYSGKTVYMKCPVDLHHYEPPVCNMPGREDNIVWTLNGKTIRFFGEDIERGPSLSPICGLTIKKIGRNDAGLYTCYRTAIDTKAIEDQPAYRHYIKVIRPDFDPPSIEEVYFGMTVCFAWHSLLLIMWAAIAIVRTLIKLIFNERQSSPQMETWTSFYDNDPTLEAGDSDEDKEDEDDEDDDEEDGEEDKEKVVNKIFVEEANKDAVNKPRSTAEARLGGRQRQRQKGKDNRKGSKDNSKGSKDNSKDGKDNDKSGKGNSKDGKDNIKGEMDYSKGGRDNSKGGRDNSKGGRDNSKGRRDNSKGRRENSKGGRDNSKGRRDNSKGRRDNSKGRRDNSKGGRDSSKGGKERI